MYSIDWLRWLLLSHWRRVKRRSKAGGKASKAEGRVASKTKRRDASKTASSTAPIQDAEVARLTRELNEALDQQAATSEVLGVISAFSGELQRVFQSMLENALRLCDAKFGVVFRFDGDAFGPLRSLAFTESCCQRFNQRCQMRLTATWRGLSLCAGRAEVCRE